MINDLRYGCRKKKEGKKESLNLLNTEKLLIYF